MGSACSAKALLARHNAQYLSDFKLNQDTSLSLPVVSSVPWISASRRKDYFEKVTYSNPSNAASRIQFITKNHVSDGFVWHTRAETLKQASRFGIVKTESITGQVISALGGYRMTAYTRISKGMVSNTQQTKLALLDIYQDRFEALEALESCVNHTLSDADYEAVFDTYIQRLMTIRDGVTHIEIIKAIDADINKTKAYLAHLKSRDLLTASRAARGSTSVLEFVKQQMISGLYELQGINQDLTYSSKRTFALTRGELNGYIEDARKIIDDHAPDLWNRVTDAHHGRYTKDDTELLAYDFSEDDLTPEREREILLGISFIEGWDTFSYHNGVPIVKNSTGEEKLDVIRATRWQTHRDFSTLLKSLAYYVLNALKGIFVATYPWEEAAWDNPEFHLFAHTLRRHVRPNEPLWKKPVRFLKHLWQELLDILTGIRDFGAHLVIRLPAAIQNDWASSAALPELDTVLFDASKAVDAVQLDEAMRLSEILALSEHRAPCVMTSNTARPVHTPYTLSPGEQSDILTAMAKGLHAFNSLFLHTIHAKDPIGGLLFSAAYSLGIAAIYFPAQTASILGAQYVNGFSRFAHTMGSSQLGAAIAGGSSQAQLVATGWDSLIDGPSSSAIHALYELGKDPLTYGAYFAAAYGLGYVLANGIAGHDVPWLSEHLRADLGTAPEAGYPIIGGKIAILSGESLEEVHQHTHLPAAWQMSVDEIERLWLHLPDEAHLHFARFRLMVFLSQHAASLPRLDAGVQHALSRQIDALFARDTSRALKQLIYPVSVRSIAFQFFSLPLAYIPMLLRVILSGLLSLAAYIEGRAYPLAPLQNATQVLWDKTAKDLTRLIAFTTHALYLPYVFISSMLKNIAAIMMMAIGRLASFCDANISLKLYQACGAVHLFCRAWTAYFFPLRIMQSVESAHPNHVLQAAEETMTSWQPTFFSASSAQTTEACDGQSYEGFLPK